METVGVVVLVSVVVCVVVVVGEVVPVAVAELVTVLVAVVLCVVVVVGEVVPVVVVVGLVVTDDVRVVAQTVLKSEQHSFRSAQPKSHWQLSPSRKPNKKQPFSSQKGWRVVVAVLVSDVVGVVLQTVAKSAQQSSRPKHPSSHWHESSAVKGAKK